MLSCTCTLWQRCHQNEGGWSIPSGKVKRKLIAVVPSLKWKTNQKTTTSLHSPDCNNHSNRQNVASPPYTDLLRFLHQTTVKRLFILRIICQRDFKNQPLNHRVGNPDCWSTCHCFVRVHWKKVALPLKTKLSIKEWVQICTLHILTLACQIL